ncbi:GyrI-like domain-containing protein [Donghicola sp. C2-DW-16]|uniref:GyrI-like domain-containing protein n=1 Tax=Donghicola mangrovi TaxID=2729614 RepID=A0ABX2PAE5_9RHOB|nr:GyrI-like domain-containing protein [Donghicola mangrovi]NVO26428.1 GyrI-like domain-containing protein [Donghicola mangrovi]
MYDVQITERPTLTLTGLHHRGPYPEMGSVYQKVAGIISAANLWPQIKGAVGVAWDNPDLVPAADLRSFAGLLVDEGFTAPDGLDTLLLPSGPHAELLYTGPYEGLRPVYQFLMGEWLPKSGRTRAAAPSYEVYLNDPTTTAPEDLQTLICAPLAS